MSEPIIEIRNLSRQFGPKTALDKVSLSVPRGCVFGLVGENGAGKTTLIKHILGLFRARMGFVSVFGMDPVRHPVEVLGQIGYLSEERDLPDWMRIEELMNYTKAFYPGWDDGFALELAATFGLDIGQKIKTLSRGQRAQTGLLAALAHRPPLLLLDEPSSGLDAVVRRDILGAIVRTVADEGRTVLFSSHLLDEVERVADEVAMIHEGGIVLDGSLDKVKETHHKLTLRFSEPRTSPPTMPGTISCQGEGVEWTVICNGEKTALKAAAEASGAKVVDEGVPSFEEIFVARVREHYAAGKGN